MEKVPEIISLGDYQTVEDKSEEADIEYSYECAFCGSQSFELFLDGTVICRSCKEEMDLTVISGDQDG